MNRFESLEIEGIEPKKEESHASVKPPCFGCYRIDPDPQCLPTCQWRALCIAVSPGMLKNKPDCYGRDKEFISNNGAGITCPWECAWAKECHKLSSEQYATSANDITLTNTTIMEVPNVTPPPMPFNYVTGIVDGLSPSMPFSRRDTPAPMIPDMQLFPPPRDPVEHPLPPSGPPGSESSGGTPPLGSQVASPMSLDYTARYGPASRGTTAAQDAIYDEIEWPQFMSHVPEESPHNQHVADIENFNVGLAVAQRKIEDTGVLRDGSEIEDTGVLRDGRGDYLCSYYGTGCNSTYIACSQCFTNKRDAYTTCSQLTQGKLEPSKSTQQEYVLGNSFNGISLSTDVVEEANEDSELRTHQTHNTLCQLYGSGYESLNTECLDCMSSRACNFHTNQSEDCLPRPFMSYGIVKALLIFAGGSLILAILLSSLLRG